MPNSRKKSQVGRKIQNVVQAQPEVLVPTSARDVRGSNLILIRVSQRLVVKMRVMDMITLTMNGLIPFHLLQAAKNFETMADNVSKAQTDEEKSKLVEQTLLQPNELGQSMDFLRKYALAVVVEPRLVEVDDGNPDHLPVNELSGEELIGIFYAHPQAREVSAVTKLQAEDFRGAEPVHAPPTPPAGEDVSRSQSQLVDMGEREFISA